MLDKNIAYKNIIMRLEKDKIPDVGMPVLPDGFSFRFFKGPEDIGNWSGIETSVLEFATEFDAGDYFIHAYMPYENELNSRCLFVVDPHQRPVATATAWYADSELGHQACLHWVAVCPGYQGRGIGKSVVQRAIQLLSELEPDMPVWLHTQTWSHVAVRLYHRLGFDIVKEDRLANMNTRNGAVKIYPNDFLQAMEVLGGVMDAKTLRALADMAV